MQAHSSGTSRYGTASIAFHWLTVLLIAAAFATIEGRILFEKGTPVRDATKEWHYALGMLIFLVTAARIVSRLSVSARPAIVPAPPAALDMLAKLVHLVLYAILIVLPILGWMTVNAEGKAVEFFFGIVLPNLTVADEAFAKQLKDLHSLIGDSLYILIGGHAVAALVHHYIMRDTTLVRMMPEGKSGGDVGQPAPAGR